MPRALKAVRIVGTDPSNHFGFAFKDGFAEQDGYVVLGDGKTAPTEEEIRKALLGRIDKDTQIHLLAHGMVDKNKNHKMNLSQSTLTADILRFLGSLSTEPIQVYIDACKSGAANKDIESLRPGSTLITSSSPDDASCNSPFGNPSLPRNIADRQLTWPARALQRMIKSAPLFARTTFNTFLGIKSETMPQSSVSSAEMFMHSLRNASQTVTFNKKLKEGSFQYTYRPFCNRAIMQQGTVENFINWSEADFMRSCFEKKACTTEEFSHALPVQVTNDEANTTLVEHICYLLTINKITAEEIQELFKINNLDPNMSNKKGWNPMSYASWSNNTEAMKALIEAGADPNVQNQAGKTPMQIAVQFGSKEAAQALTEMMGKTENKIRAHTPADTDARKNKSFVSRLEESRVVQSPRNDINI